MLECHQTSLGLINHHTDLNQSVTNVSGLLYADISFNAPHVLYPGQTPSTMRNVTWKPLTSNFPRAILPIGQPQRYGLALGRIPQPQGE